jgi:hypothetical protein
MKTMFLAAFVALVLSSCGANSEVWSAGAGYHGWYVPHNGRIYQLFEGRCEQNNIPTSKRGKLMGGVVIKNGRSERTCWTFNEYGDVYILEEGGDAAVVPGYKVRPIRRA